MHLKAIKGTTVPLKSRRIQVAASVIALSVHHPQLPFFFFFFFFCKFIKGSFGNHGQVSWEPWPSLFGNQGQVKVPEEVLYARPLNRPRKAKKKKRERCCSFEQIYRTMGLISADRSNKATLLLTIPRSIKVVCNGFISSNI
jgi:hypothetical protein